MSSKPSPFTDLVVPLTREGGAGKGTRLAIRGDGDYRILRDRYGVRKPAFELAMSVGAEAWLEVDDQPLLNTPVACGPP